MTTRDPLGTRDRARLALLRGGTAVLRRLPEGLVLRGAFALGWASASVLRERRALVRDNLRQTLAGLVERDLADAPSRAALADPRRLERLVRRVFGHWVLAYMEAILVSGYDERRLRDRVDVGDPALAAVALRPVSPGTPGRLFISLHFGSVELPARHATAAGLRLVAPMETVTDPALQRWALGMRAASGVEVVDARGAAERLRRELSDGGAVALVADRAVTGAGARVRLLGAEARLPLGPAVLALESGAEVWVLGMQRTGWGRWRAHLERLGAPAATLPRRQRLSLFLEREARAIERIVAAAPAQWWTLLFPIWEPRAATEPADLPVAA